MTFLLGGVAPQEIAVAYLVLAVSAFVYGSLGLAFSSFVKSTVNSTLVSYLAAVAVFLLTGILTAVGSNNMFSGTPIVGRACLVAFNPMGAIGAATMSESYFGVLIPSWLTSLVMNGFLGSLFLLTALHRLEYPKSDRSGLLRGLTAGFVALATLGLCGSFISEKLLGDIATGIGVMACLPAVVGPILACLFATGAGVEKSGWLALKKGAPKSGLAFALLTALLSIAIGAVTTVRFPTVRGDFRLDIGFALCAGLVSLAATFGIGGLGLALSAWTKNRWVAMAIAFGVAALLFGIPLTNLNASEPSFANRFQFLSPISAVADASGIDELAEHSGLIGQRFWQVTVGFYLLLGAAGIAVANRKSR